MKMPPIVSPQEWEAAREELLPSVTGAGAGAAVRAPLDNAAPATRTAPRRMTGNATLHMERTFQAPAEAVFDA